MLTHSFFGKFDNPIFQDVDVRLQTSETVSKLWKEKIYSDDFINASDDFYDQLWPD